MMDRKDFPLFVDLDGSLIQTDLLFESVALLLGHRPWETLRLPLWLLLGRSQLKARLVARCAPKAELLPYNQQVLAFLQGEAQRGRSLILATANDVHVAQAVAKHCRIFEGILATNGGPNLKGRAKLAAIENCCQTHGWTEFGYLGDSRADLPIWEAAAECYAVSPTKRLLRRLPPDRKPHLFGKTASSFWRLLLSTARLPHWAKNLLVFVPLAAAHKVNDWQAVLLSVVAFVCFGLMASGAYILNDIFDIENDRRHPVKKMRPIPAGQLSIPRAFVAALSLTAGGTGLALFFLPGTFTATLIIYAALTLTYSSYLKHKLLADVITLAVLYTLRIIAGAMAISVDLSHWLGMFSVFLFVSLAFAKRDSELRRITQEGSTRVQGRGYESADIPIVHNVGVTCGCLAVLVLAFYIQSDQVSRLYKHPQLLWVLCLGLLYWITRIWFLTARSELPEDPIVFALRDRRSHAVALICGAAIAAASF